MLLLCCGQDNPDCWFGLLDKLLKLSASEEPPLASIGGKSPGELLLRMSGGTRGDAAGADA